MSQQLKKFKAQKPSMPPTSGALYKYNKYQTELIDKFIECYHNATWIHFQDCIQYETNEEYLKRYYKAGEFRSKIKLLGDYYRFHFQVPRIFMAGVARIIQVNVEDKRELQFAIVTREMHKKENEDEDDFPVINTNRAIEQHEKLIKDVELSYEDFQEKPKKKRSSRGERVSQDLFFSETVKIEEQKVVKTMSRVDSIKFKGNFLVFKPKNQSVKPEEGEKNKMELKYKKPKHEKKEKVKKNENSKKEANSKSKHTSKLVSNNNSVTSHQGLSRSKSRTHLNIVQSKNFGKQTENMNERSNNPSLQSSLTKSLNKKQILGEKKGAINAIPRKYSKIELGSENKAIFKGQNESQKSSKPSQGVSRKPSQSQLDPNGKRMFNKALEIKKKK